MAPRKRKPQPTREVSFTPKKVSKRKTRAKPSMKVSAPTSKSSTSHRVERYRNGLLNLEKTPSHLVPIVHRNSTESALLCLPPEIRALIWRSTLGGQLVILDPTENGGRGRAVCYTQDRKFNVDQYYNSRTTRSRRQEKLLPAAFHLPEVCRQIYSETALTAYTYSTFTIGPEYMNPPRSLYGLGAAQRGAISSVEPNPFALDFCLDDEDDILHGKPYHPLKQTFFPNLKTIVIGKLAFKFVRQNLEVGPGANASEEDWKQWITHSFKRREGNSIQVEFKDPDPNW